VVSVRQNQVKSPENILNTPNKKTFDFNKQDIKDDASTPK
jgi:hypothetical protein